MTATPMPPAVLLAGGLGTRIRLLAGDTPKVLLPVEGKPFVAHLLAQLHGQGVKEAVLCLGHAAERVWDAAQTYCPSGMTLAASREEAPLGTGGAVRRALDLVPGIFFILNGDTYLEVSLPGLLAAHRTAGAGLTLTLVRSNDSAERGSVRISPEGRVLDFVEKTAEGTGLVNAGVYAASKRFFAGLEPGRAVSLERDVLPAALGAGETVASLRVDGSFVDIGLPETYLAVRDHLPRGGDRP